MNGLGWNIEKLGLEGWVVVNVRPFLCPITAARMLGFAPDDSVERRVYEALFELAKEADE